MHDDRRQLLLDLFCGAGGCAVGYHRAGFDVVGVDHRPQPRYPFPFREGDALETLEKLIAGHDLVTRCGKRLRLADVAAIHASPPCQAYSRATAWRGDRASHPDLIGETRELLESTGKPWVIENVQEARPLLRHPIMLCGSMFGLRVRRHRYFECPGLPLVLVRPCQHRRTDYSHDHGAKQTEAEYRDAMGCDWMSVQEARQAIPPAYCQFIGRQLLNVVSSWEAHHAAGNGQ
jgi:hypothetical protein